MFQRRNDAARDAGGSTVGVEMSRSLAIKRQSFSERGWGPEETGPTLGWHAVVCGISRGGRMTWSMTWMTPFDAITSGVTTLALSFR